MGKVALKVDGTVSSLRSNRTMVPLKMNIKVVLMEFIETIIFYAFATVTVF